MRINHNISSLNAWRSLTQTDNALSKSLERLSSGLRVNRAADDAAGLAISEKMRSQISGIQMAQRNAQDAISLIQTAEGALNESHSILQRMRELAVQASSDTLTSNDRAEIQKEIDQLVAELDRIGNNTEFNSKTLLDGSAQVSVTEDALTTEAKDFTATGETTAGSYTLTDVTLATVASAVSSNQSGGAALGQADTLTQASTLSINNYTFSFGDTHTVDDVLETINAMTADTGVEASFAGGVMSFKTTATGSGATIDLVGTGDFAAADGALAVVTARAAGTDAAATITGYANDYVSTGNKVEFVKGDLKGLAFTVTGDSVAAGRTIDVGSNGSLTFQIGANANQSLNVSIGDMRATNLGVNAVDVTTKDNASAAITTVDTAVGTVSTERSKLGAVQNRLEHTIANLGTAAENLTAAESRIRDVDMALEMANFTRNQILLQSGTAMLAQANMKPQAVLQLLG